MKLEDLIGRDAALDLLEKSEWLERFNDIVSSNLAAKKIESHDGYGFGRISGMKNPDALFYYNSGTEIKRTLEQFYEIARVADTEPALKILEMGYRKK